MELKSRFYHHFCDVTMGWSLVGTMINLATLSSGTFTELLSYSQPTIK
jgi:hypothetical protein